MKTLAATLCAFGLIGFTALAQDAKTDIKEAGHETKQAAKDTGHAVVHGTKTAGRKIKHGTKKVVHGTASATEHGAEKVKDKTAPND
jgi:hypothetical protein